MLRQCLSIVLVFFGAVWSLSYLASAEATADKKKEEAELIAKEITRYPLGACVVSGKALNSMGKPVNHLHEGRLVRFCCAGCVAAFEKTPDVYLAKIDEAAQARWRPLEKERLLHAAPPKAGCGCVAGKSCGSCGTKAESGCGNGCGGCGSAHKPKAEPKVEVKSGCGSGCGGCGSAPKPKAEPKPEVKSGCGSGCGGCR